jgi:hypothetical protein
MQTKNHPPAFIEIMGQKVKIKVKKSEDHGLYSHDKKTITVDRDLLDDPEELMSTLFHESIHAALAISGVRWVLGADDEEIMPKEEALVRCLEQAFKGKVFLFGKQK